MIVLILSGILVVIGTLFVLISAIGVLRLPDMYLRMSSSTKNSTLGVGTILLATAIYFGELGVSTRAIATIFFVLLTAPVAAHMIGRAAYFNGVPLWVGTLYNDLKGRYDAQTHTLASVIEPPHPAPLLKDDQGSAKR